MAVVKVETFDVSPSTDGTTHTLTNDVGSLTSAFVKINGSNDKGSGRVGSTGNAGPRDTHMGVSLTATDEITFHKGGTLQMRKMGEVWRYTGSPGGLDEFIVRGHLSITLAGGVASNTAAIPSLGDRNKVVPFLTGLSSTSTSTSDHDSTTVAVFVNASDELVATRQSTGQAITVYVSVVEFTGINWSVGHGVSTNHDTAQEIVTLNTDSTGTGGSVFDVGDWSNAFLEGTTQGDTAETGLSDNLFIAEPGATTTQVRVFFQQDGNARNDGDAYVHAVVNAGMVVTRDSNTNFPETNGTIGTLGFPPGTSSSALLDELALEWFADTSGVGTAHSRGRVISRITNASGTIEHWVHRSGNNVAIYYGVINLTGVQGVEPVTITSAPTQIDAGDLNLVVIGTNFEATQGAGTVYISDTASVGSGTNVVQSIDTWSDTSIQFDSNLAGLPDGIVYIIVENASGGTAAWLLNKGIPPYTEVITTMINQPDHYHTFDNTYVASLGGFAANSLNAGTGTVGFFLDPGTRGRTHSWGPTGSASRIEMLDSPFTNVTNTHRRRFIAGFFKFPEVPLDPKGIWEEGGNVNNIYMIIGFGGRLLCNVADSSNGFKLQAFSDFILTPNRWYHIGILFDGDVGCRCYIDGVLQQGFDGVAPNSDQATHSGDFSYGQPDGSLDTGGTDISYPSFSGSRYNDWKSWSDTGNDVPPDTDIRIEVFEKGARTDLEILSDTPANMQLAANLLSGTSYPDTPLAIKVNRPSGGGDLTLTFDDVTFEERTSIQIQWTGGTGETLTIINSNGSNIELEKCSTAYGGTIEVIDTVVATITVLDFDQQPIQNARVYVEASSGGPLVEGTVLFNDLTDTNGTVSFNFLYDGNAQPVVGRTRKSSVSPLFKSQPLTGSITSSGLNLTVFMDSDE